MPVAGLPGHVLPPPEEDLLEDEALLVAEDVRRCDSWGLGMLHRHHPLMVVMVVVVMRMRMRMMMMRMRSPY